jgi:Putative porin
MLIRKITLQTAGASLAAIALLTAHPVRAQSESARIEKLEQAVEMLQKENTQLKAEVSSLKKQSTSGPIIEGKTKTEVTYDGKNYVEKSVPLEKSSADKWKLSTSITEMELYGDVRLRYQYNGGETQSRGPVASPPANGVAGTNDWQERERERYRLRLGLRGTFLDDWFFGLRLETSNNARSTNVTFGDDTASNTPGGGGPFEKNSDTIYVGQAYGGYKGFPGFTFTGGRMPNPLVTTRMVWDPDINPEGLAEQWRRTFVFGAEAPPPPSYSKDYSKDGKAVVAPKPPEPFLKLDIFANFGQFVYDDTNPENPLGARSTTTANGSKQLIPNTDAFLLAWQVGARFNFPNNFYFQFAPTLYNYTGNGDTFNIHYVGGDPRLTNNNSLNFTNQTGINSLLVFDVPMEFGWKAWGIPMRIFGDFATNFEGDDRANAAVQSGPPAAQPGPGHGSQRYAYQAGLGIGQLKKKGDWQIDLWYQQIQQFALDPNLIDDDIFNAQENMHGIAVQATYNFTAAVNLQLTYAHGWWYNHNLGTGGNVGSLAIATNPTTEYNFFTADLNFKF